jgi:hypothetical protein
MSTQNRNLASQLALFQFHVTRFSSVHIHPSSHPFFFLCSVIMSSSTIIVSRTPTRVYKSGPGVCVRACVRVLFCSSPSCVLLSTLMIFDVGQRCHSRETRKSSFFVSALPLVETNMRRIKFLILLKAPVRLRIWSPTFLFCSTAAAIL